MKLLSPFRLDARHHLQSALRLVLTVAFVGLIALTGPFTSAASATGIYDFERVQAGESTWVVDQADVLSRFKQGQISNRLEQINQKTGDEVRFVVFRRLDYGETIESFTNELFETWFPDAESSKNQVLIGLDVLTNTTAIRVGEEAGSALTDDIAASVVEETMMAPIRQGGDQYNQSILDASDRLIAVLSGEEDPGPPVIEDRLRVEGTFASKEETQESNATVIVIVLLIVATVVPMVTYFAYVR